LWESTSSGGRSSDHGSPFFHRSGRNFTLVAVPSTFYWWKSFLTTGIVPISSRPPTGGSTGPRRVGVASIFAAAVFGAMCGVSIAGVAVIGVIAVPEMLKRGYDPIPGSRSVTASGALAMLIPRAFFSSCTPRSARPR